MSGKVHQLIEVRNQAIVNSYPKNVIGEGKFYLPSVSENNFLVTITDIMFYISFDLFPSEAVLLVANSFYSL